MASELSSKKAILFIDDQNLFYAARACYAIEELKTSQMQG